MRILLLGAATLLISVASMNAQTVKDPAVYTPVNGYELRSLWIKSMNTNNNIADALGDSRGMVAYNGELLFCKKTGDPAVSSIDIYDAATGAFKKNLVLSDVFVKTDGTAVGFPCNDIHVDNAGHILVSNLAANIVKGNFQVWSVNLTDGKGVKVLDAFLPDLTTAAGIRIDAFGVYGDVTKDGYIMAAVAGDEAGVGNQVIRWDIKGGVVGEATLITIQSYVPAKALTNGAAPRVCPVDNDLFYLDGFNTYATLYDMNGVIVDDFTKAVNCAPISEGNNGIGEFKLNGKDFITYIYSNTVAKPAQAWNLCELGSGMQFSGMTQYFQFPANGIGTASNAPRTAIPYIVINKAGTVATIYVYAYKSGVAAYQFGLSKDLEKTGTGIMNANNNSLQITTTATGVALSEAANVEVFNFAGQKVISKDNVNALTLAPGMYIVKALTAEGLVATEKVCIK